LAKAEDNEGFVTGKMNTASLLRLPTMVAGRAIQNSTQSLKLRPSPLSVEIVRTAKKAAAAVSSKKKMEVETDPKKLVKYLCGSNYLLEGGQDVELKPDSEYPEWLFTMDVKRPVPTARELPEGTREYFEALLEEKRLRARKLSKKKYKKG